MSDTTQKTVLKTQPQSLHQPCDRRKNPVSNTGTHRHLCRHSLKAPQSLCQTQLCWHSLSCVGHSRGCVRHSQNVSDTALLCQTPRRLCTEYYAPSFLKTKQNPKNKTRCLIHRKPTKPAFYRSRRGRCLGYFTKPPQNAGQAQPKA